MRLNPNLFSSFTCRCKSVLLSKLLWINTFKFSWSIRCTLNKWIQRRSSGLVGLEIIHNLKNITELLIEGDHIVSCVCLKQRFCCNLQLEGVTQQVEDKGQIKIWQVYKTFLFLYISFVEICLKLPTIVPSIVNMGRNLLWSIQERICPSVALGHFDIKSVKSV